MVDNNEPRPGTAELLKVLESITRFSGRLDRGTVDLSRARTEIGRLKEQLCTSMDRIDGATLASAVGHAVGAVTPEDIAATFAKLPPRPRRRRCRELNEYLDVVERDAPFALGIVFAGSKLFGLGFTAKSLEAIGKLRDAARGSGEPRIEALRVAAGFILESLYKELITVLYEIECVRLSRPITVRTFGNLVNYVADSTRDLLPGFVDRHAAKIRNAAYHDSWQESAVGTNVIDLHGTEPALRSMTPPQIYQRLSNYYRDVQDVVHCIMWRATASLLLLCGRPPLPHALAAVFAAKPHDEALADQVGEVLGNAVRGAATRLVAVNWSPRAQPHPPPAGS